MERVFFYGLFMDVELLRRLGVRPQVVGRALVDGYRLDIGARATLTPDQENFAYGMLIDLPPQEIEALYRPPDVRRYRPITLAARLLDGDGTHEASCYVLPPGDDVAAPDRDYARRLAVMLLQLGFPPSCAEALLAVARP